MSSRAAYSGKATGRVPDLIVGFVMFMLLRALHHAHTYDFGDGIVGLVHRDVSPGNVLINDKQGFVKLTDFGVAVRQDSGTTTGGLVGKVPYMAPEVLVDEEVDTRADIYSLGLVAYELLTGINPNVHPLGLKSILSAITNVMLELEKPLRPPHEVIEGVNPELSQIVAKMLSFAPEDRYQSADRIIADIVPVLYGGGVGPGAEALVEMGRPLARYALIGEPTGMVPVRQHFVTVEARYTQGLDDIVNRDSSTESEFAGPSVKYRGLDVLVAVLFSFGGGE